MFYEGAVDPRLCQIVLPIEGDELSTDPLQLGKADRRSGQLYHLIADRNLATNLTDVVFLPLNDLAHDFLGDLVELIQIIRLGSWLLLSISVVTFSHISLLKLTITVA